MVDALVPWVLALLAVIEPLLTAAGVTSTLALMWLVAHSPARNRQRWIFGSAMHALSSRWQETPRGRAEADLVMRGSAAAVAPQL